MPQTGPISSPDEFTYHVVVECVAQKSSQIRLQLVATAIGTWHVLWRGSWHRDRGGDMFPVEVAPRFHSTIECCITVGAATTPHCAILVR